MFAQLIESIRLEARSKPSRKQLNRHYALVKQADDPLHYADTSRVASDLDKADVAQPRGSAARASHDDFVRSLRVAQRKERMAQGRVQRAMSAVGRHKARKRAQSGDTGFGRMTKRAKAAMK